MYTKIKKNLFQIIPKNFILKNEVWLRNLHYHLFYKGNNHECSICKKKVKQFLKNHNHLICPNCGSIQRNRRLWQLLDQEFIINNTTILDFSPSRVLFRKLKNNKKINYISTDFENEFIADYSFDITNIDLKSKSIHLIICYHILEHIENDKKAMQELFRILKNGGKALIQTPFKDGEIYEDYSITDPEERKIHFGQEDHVRFYSIDGLKNRLENEGFNVEIRKFDKEEYYLGLETNETILICHKE
ncbi:class I SAM-dependent methyltransferase [Flavobacterium ardleyense]|uniref:Class I SAM-dependent methyltransferase n=1 Tax=Flavobacterium ardleyense TaxID=2038737 RepID=A0ABW5Z6N8_9FLAO